MDTGRQRTWWCLQGSCWLISGAFIYLRSLQITFVCHKFELHTFNIHCLTIFIEFTILMREFCHAGDTHDSEPRTWAGHGTQHSSINQCPHNKVLRPKIQDMRTCPGHVQDMSRTLPTKIACNTCLGLLY